jgi:cytochrome b6-f complex iron-sulfur subunit
MLRANVSPQTQADSKPPSRREFLYYLLGASAAVTSAGTCAGLYWFTQQRVIYGTDLFVIDLDQIPRPDRAPHFLIEYPCFLMHVEGGLLALRPMCTAHDSTGVKWSEENERFECPACGTRYYRDGSFWSGIAPRGLERYLLHVTTPDGTFSTPEDGSPVPAEGATRIVLDTRKEIKGAPRPSRERF